MKKLLALIFSCIMIFSFCACGSGSTDQKADEAAEQTPTCWTVVSIEMEGTVLDEDSIQELLGMTGAQMMTLSLRPSGTAYINIGEEPALAMWEETEDGYALSYKGESMPLTKNDDGTLTFIQKSVYQADGQDVEAETKIILAEQETLPEGLEEDPLYTLDPYMTPEQTCRMSTFMNWGFYCIEDNVLYGIHTGDIGWELASRSFDPNGDKTWIEFKDDTKILDSCYATYLTKYGDYLYYIRNDGGGKTLCRIKTDGSGKETLYDKLCDGLSISDERLYFTDENHHLVSMDPEGGNLATLLEKEVYYPYPICSGWFIYQDDANNECLTLYHIVSGTEIPLNECRSYSPILIGHELYYYTEADGTEGPAYLCKMDIVTGQSETGDQPIGVGIGSDGEKIWTTNQNVAKLDEWKTLTSNENETGCTDREMYFSKDYSVYHELDGNNTVTGKYLRKNATGGGQGFK